MTTEQKGLYPQGRRKWQPTPVLLPGESCGQRSLEGSCPQGRTELDTTEVTWHACMHWRQKWQPIPVFLPGESQGQRSLVGCRLWGRTESVTAEVTQQQQHTYLMGEPMGCTTILKWDSKSKYIDTIRYAKNMTDRNNMLQIQYENKTSVQILTVQSGKNFVQDWCFRTRSAHNRLIVVRN